MCSLERRRWWALGFAKNRHNCSQCTPWFPFHFLCGQEQTKPRSCGAVMCMMSTYLRSLRGVIPLIALPGNASALLLIVPRKHNLKVKKRKMERQPEKQIFSFFFFFQSKLGITFYSVSSVKIYSLSESLSRKNGVAVFYLCDWEKKLDLFDWRMLYISVELLIPLGTVQLIGWIKFTEHFKIDYDLGL